MGGMLWYSSSIEQKMSQGARWVDLTNIVSPTYTPLGGKPRGFDSSVLQSPSRHHVQGTAVNQEGWELFSWLEEILSRCPNTLGDSTTIGAVMFDKRDPRGVGLLITFWQQSLSKPLLCPGGGWWGFRLADTSVGLYVTGKGTGTWI